MKHRPCLILNQDYFPLTIVSWQRAMCLQIIGKEVIGEGVRVLEYYKDDYVTSAGGQHFPIPAVAVTNRYVKRRRKVSLRKRNLLIRDKYQCQYCGKELSTSAATIDHVVPRSHFKGRVKDAHTWDNTVISCYPCNSKKDNKTPDQADMKLLQKPYEPDVSQFYKGFSIDRSVPEEWLNYVGS